MPDYGAKKNKEGYPDPTAYQALRNIQAAEDAEKKRISELIRTLKYIIDLAGYEMVGGIQLRGKPPGKGRR